MKLATELHDNDTASPTMTITAIRIAPYTIHLLYLSNLIESKGVYALLDACKLLKDRGVAFACDFVGGESKQITRALFDEAVRMCGLEGVVTYHGPKYGADKEAYWQAADIFVFPTFYYNECFPLVALETMQHGVPVVTSDEGGIPDIVEDGVTGAIVSAQTIREHSVNEMLGSSATEEERTKSRAFNLFPRHRTCRPPGAVATGSAVARANGTCRIRPLS